MKKSIKTQRKIISLLLSLVMILTALPLAGITAFAEKYANTYDNVVVALGNDETSAAVTLTVDKDSAQIGKILTIYLGVENLSSVYVNFNYDVYCFELVDARATATTTMTTDINDSYAAGQIKIAGSASTAVSGDIAVIALRYKGGNGVISADVLSALDENDDDVTVDSVSLTITENTSVFDYEILEDGTAIITGYYGNDEEINIPAEIDGYRVSQIYYSTFENSDAVIKKIIIPDGISYLYEALFNNCYALESIEVDEGNEYYSSIDGVLFNKDKTTLIKFPAANAATLYSIPDTVECIDDYAFYDCANLTSVTIGNSVTIIGEYAFAYCDSLTSITIPDSVTYIHYGAFLGCDHLKEIYILNKECYINDYDYCTIPSGVTIHGYKGSTAEEYAYTYDIDFVAIDDDPTDLTHETKGDINGDGKITTVDAKWILQRIANSRNFSEEQTKAADLNGDGKISVVDVKWVLQIVAGTRNPDTLELIKK